MDASSALAPPPLPAGRRSLHRFANPGRFLRVSGRVLPPLAAFAVALSGGGAGLGPVLLARRLAAGRRGADHVRACALRVAGLVGLLRAGAVLRRLAGLAASAGRPGGGRDRPGGGGGRGAVPGQRQPVGQADLGHLVGVGRAADLGAGAVLPVSGTHRAGARLRRPAARLSRRGDPGAGRRGGPADHQIFGRMVEYAAPAGQHHADSARRPCMSECCGRC